jgi:uncharacterized delta-60 repeat protein
MSGSRTRRLHVANALGLACVAATCFLAACGDSDDSGDNTPRAGAGGSSGKSGSGGAGTAGAISNGGSAVGQAGEENVAGETGEGGEAGAETGGTAGSAGGTAGSAGSITAGSGGSAGTSGASGSGGAPPVLIPNCVRELTSGKKVEISATGNDGLFGAAYGPDGKLYATGYVQSGVGAAEDRSTVVVRLTEAGALDTTWATGGIATVNVRATAAGLPGLAELPRGIAFQGDKIIVAGTVEAYTTAQTKPALNNDRDVYVLRLTPAGLLDATFGDSTTPGIHILPLNTGTLVVNATTGAETLSAADSQWGLNVLSDKSIIVTAATRSPLPPEGTTPRTDSDFAVVKLTENGAQDTTFGLGATGIFTLDVASANASVRTASVLSDGKLIVTGYSSFNGTQRPVIFKLLANGSALDPSFGLFGVFSDSVGSAAEAYGALVQTGGKLVTVGYGRASSANTSSDILSIRLTASGLLDNSYGAAATPGRAWFDVGGLGDNGRAIVLSDDRPVLLGGGSLSAGQQDAVVALLDVDGKPVTSFGSPFGCTAYDFGSIGDFFWSGAVAPDGKIAAVGLTGHGTGSTDDTDGIFLLINKP